MRQIKFRAWDCERMFCPGDGLTDTITFGFNQKTAQPNSIGIGEQDYDYIIGYNWYSFNDLNPKPYPVEVMQFTGLVDKNGVEIYEGDIVEYQSKSHIDNLMGRPFSTYQHPISWNEENCCWWVESASGFKPNKETDDGKFLIIGNIYQHPHLLK